MGAIIPEASRKGIHKNCFFTQPKLLAARRWTPAFQPRHLRNHGRPAQGTRHRQIPPFLEMVEAAGIEPGTALFTKPLKSKEDQQNQCIKW